MIDEQTGSSLSRRSLVKTTATAAAVGGALVLAGPAVTASAATGNEHSAATRSAGHDDHGQDAGDAGGVLVRVLDARLGTLEVFTSAGHRTITDSSLAAQLARLGR